MLRTAESPAPGGPPRRRHPAKRVPPTWRRIPFLLLILSFVLAGVGAWEAHRAIAGHQETVDGVLRDYAAFAAWTYGRHAEEAFLGAVGYTFRPVIRAMSSGAPLPHPQVLLETDAEEAACECEHSFAGDFALRIPVISDERGLEVSGEGFEPRGNPAAVERIREAALEAIASRRATEIVPVEVGGTRRLVAVLPVGCPDEGGVDVVYAVDVDRDRLAALLLEIHGERDLLPPTLAGDQGNAALLRIAVAEPGGDVLVGGAPILQETGVARAPMGAHFGDLEVTAAVVPDAAGRLVIGGLPRSRAPFMLGIFGLAILLGVVAAGQLRRENELAFLRSDFVASVSHELRTPLAQIRLFLETLRMGRFRTAGEREWSLATMDRETRRLSHLVENVLRFSQDEKGAFPQSIERVELASELRDIEEGFRPLARARDAEVRIEAEPGQFALVHRDSFRQAVLNFLDNAVKYGPKGQTVRVAAECVGGRTRVAVEDEGPGIPVEDREEIWAPFRRGSQAGGREAGSGIGLSVVREIAARSGGKAWVEGAARRGARFVLELPGGRARTLDGAGASSAAGPAPLRGVPPATAPSGRSG
jgi:signal transduction histidine kinase